MSPGPDTFRLARKIGPAFECACFEDEQDWTTCDRETAVEELIDLMEHDPDGADEVEVQRLDKGRWVYEVAGCRECQRPVDDHEQGCWIHAGETSRGEG